MNHILLIFLVSVTIGQVININMDELSNNKFNNEMEHESTFQQRLKMLPIKVLLQINKSKSGISSGLAKTMQFNSTRKVMEGLQESSGALFGLFKDGIGNLGTLVFGN